jgi:hypothetical protein
MTAAVLATVPALTATAAGLYLRPDWLSLFLAGNSMRIGRCLAELDCAKRAAALCAKGAVGFVDEALDLGGRDAWIENRSSAAVDFKGQRHRLADQAEFGGRFAHATTVNDCGGFDDVDSPERAAHSLGDCKGQLWIDSCGARTRLAQNFGDPRTRIFVLFPGADLGIDGQAGAQRSELEHRADHERFTRRHQQHRDEAFGRCPGKAAEVTHAGPGTDQHRIDSRLRHQAPSVVQSQHSFIDVDGHPGIFARLDGCQLGFAIRSADATVHGRDVPLLENR